MTTGGIMEEHDPYVHEDTDDPQQENDLNTDGPALAAEERAIQDAEELAATYAAMAAERDEAASAFVEVFPGTDDNPEWVGADVADGEAFDPHAEDADALGMR